MHPVTWPSAVGLMMLATGALANGPGESGAWSFQSSTDKANKAGVASQIEQAKAGYGPSTTTITYNVDGDLVNCNLNSTAVGNTANSKPVYLLAIALPARKPTTSRTSDCHAGITYIGCFIGLLISTKPDRSSVERQIQRAGSTPRWRYASKDVIQRVIG